MTSRSSDSFGYDALGRCVRRVSASNSSASATYYIYAGANPIIEYDGNSQVSAYNVYGGGVDEILLRDAGTPRWYLQDRLGSVTATADANGEISEHYEYDAWGTPTIRSGPVAGNPRGTIVANPEAGNRFMFTGREWVANYGFYEYRARAYNPSLGRFMSEDPTGFAAGDTNLYRYCGGDPVNGRDPYGLFNAGKFFTGLAVTAGAGVGLGFLITADLTSGGVLTPVVAGASAFLIGKGFTGGAALIAEGIFDSKQNPLNGTDNMITDPAQGIGRIIGPNVEKGVDVAEAAASIALAGVDAYDANTYAKSLANVSDIAQGVVDITKAFLPRGHTSGPHTGGGGGSEGAFGGHFSIDITTSVTPGESIGNWGSIGGGGGGQPYFEGSADGGKTWDIQVPLGDLQSSGGMRIIPAPPEKPE